MKTTIKLLPRKLKYNILNRLSEFENEKGVRDEVASRLKISRTTLWRYLNFKYESDGDIPANVLFEFAKLFDCTVEDLISEKIAA